MRTYFWASSRGNAYSRAMKTVCLRGGAGVEKPDILEAEICCSSGQTSSPIIIWVVILFLIRVLVGKEEK